MEEEKFFICTCHSIEHQALFYEVDGEIYVQFHLVKSGFFRRFVRGIKYIFGYRSRYGEWDEFIFKDEDLNELKQFLEKREV